MTTSPPFQESLFGDDADFSRAGSRVSPSQSPGTDWARKMTAISGRKCFALSEKSVHSLLLRRMFEGLLNSTRWYSSACWLTWKTKVTASERLLFQLAPSTRLIDATGYGLLPTPQAFDATGIERSEEALARAKQKGGCSNLREVAKLLPTPTENGNYNRKGLSPTSGDGLATAVKMLPTPKASKVGGYSSPGFRPTLETTVLLATPTAQDGANNAGASQFNRNSLPLNAQIGGSLNPSFVEAMMGYQSGWTEIEPSG